MFDTSTSTSQNMEDTPYSHQQALSGWSRSMGSFSEEYERFMTLGSEHRANLQPLPPSMAAGFVC